MAEQTSESQTPKKSTAVDTTPSTGNSDGKPKKGCGTRYPFCFSDLREGDSDPTLNKTVKWLVDSDDDFIVYIDTDNFVEWNMNDNDLLGPDTGPHLNRVGQLEAVDLSNLNPERQTSFKRMVAEGVARLFQKNLQAAQAALDFADKWIASRNNEVARRWYLTGSGIVAGLCAFAVIMLGLTQNPNTLRQVPYLNITFGAAMGGLGAWLSVIQRSRTTELDVAAGSLLHYLEGAFRIMVGMLGALLIALAIRSGLFPQVSALSMVLVMCMVAGVSERLVPSFIEQVESRTPK